jgi:hypothetical protein
LETEKTAGSSTRSEAELERIKAERDALAREVDTLKGRRTSRGGRFRRFFVALLVILSCILTTAVLAGGWAFRTVFNTDKWVERVVPVIEDRAVTDALSRRLTDQIFSLINVEELTAEALPPRAAPLAGPLTSAVHDAVEDRVAEVLASSEFERIWIQANRFAHEQIIAVLRDEGDVIQRTGGEVSLNLLPAINAAIARIEAQASGLFGRDITIPEISAGEVPEAAREKIESALGVQLPEDFGEIPVYNSDKIVAAQDAMATLDRILLLLVIAAPLTLIAALALSRSRRRTLIQWIVGSLLGLVIVRRLLMWVEDEVVALAREENRGAARSIVDTVLSSFFSLSQAIMVVALLVLAVIILTGPYGWAVSFRRWVRKTGGDLAVAIRDQTHDEGTARWVAAHRDPLLLAGSVFAVMLFWIFDLSWFTFLMIAGLLIAYCLVVIRVAGRDTTSAEAERPARVEP